MAMITLTPCAQDELKRLLTQRQAGADEGLRLQIDRGGCAGLQYVIQIDQAHADDTVIEQGGVRVFVDPASLKMLDGSVVDYADDLNDSGFKIQNPNAARACGCGTSFEPAVAGT